MTPTRLLVTGAAGFVGRHFLRAARAAYPASHIVAAARPDDVPPAGLPGADAVAAFDLLDPSGIAAVIAETKPDVCVHLAAWSDVAASFTAQDIVWRANVDGTRALAGAIMRSAPHCLLLSVGSADCYGLSFQADQALDETALLRPANPYAAAKAAADICLGEMALRGLRAVRLRPVNHVGPGQSPRFAVAAFARQVARVAAGVQPQVIETGALDRWRDFVDVRDMCAAYLSVIANAGALPAGAVFNLASGAQHRLGDVLADLLRLAGVTARIETAEAALRPVDIVRASCSPGAARAALAWAPCITWEQTLHDILAYWASAI